MKKKLKIIFFVVVAALLANGLMLFQSGLWRKGVSDDKVWENIRKRDAQHETLRRLIESGQPIDPEVADRLLSATSGNKDLSKDLRVASYIMFALVPGLLALGGILALLNPQVFTALAAVSALVGCLGAGMLVVAKVLEKQAQA